MIKKRCLVTILVIMILGLGRSYCEAQSAKASRDVQNENELRFAIQQIAQGGKSLYQGRAKLSELPAEDVVPAICNALEHNSSFQNNLQRVQAYQVLQEKYAATTRIGREALISGLEDPRVQVSCAMSLGNSPPESFDQVIPSLGKFLLDEKTKPTMLRQVLRTLGRFEAPANVYLDKIKSFLDNPQADKRVRSEAAAALVLIGGIEGRIEEFEKLDEEGKHAVLRSLFRIADRTKGTFRTDTNGRAKLRAFVFSHLGDDDKETRKISIQLCLFVLGKQIRMPQPEGDTAYREIRDALQARAQIETDKELREVISGGLQNLERAASRAKK